MGPSIGDFKEWKAEVKVLEEKYLIPDVLEAIHRILTAELLENSLKGGFLLVELPKFSQERHNGSPKPHFHLRGTAQGIYMGEEGLRGELRIFWQEKLEGETLKKRPDTG